ncbi:MAG: uridylate kinase, partial [Methylococcales bacterium]|nr:uridylate kinase [Methylococcales bacterium]
MSPNIVIVAGGGLFADHVRQTQKKWCFNETIAHEMAILAMQQMALLFKGLQPTFQCIDSVDHIKLQIGQHP